MTLNLLNAFVRGLERPTIKTRPPTFISVRYRFSCVATPGSLLNGLQGLPRLAVSYIFKGLDSISPVESKDERIRILKRVEFYSAVEAGALGLLSGLSMLFITILVYSYSGTILSDTFWESTLILASMWTSNRMILHMQYSTEQICHVGVCELNQLEVHL